MQNKDILLVGSEGYIGSELGAKSKHRDRFIFIDSRLRHTKFTNPNTKHMDYRNITDEELNSYSTIVWLAGHASVPQSTADPKGCLDNNLISLINFFDRFRGRLIYASSGSVYSDIGSTIASESSPLSKPSNVYDYSKMAFDYYQLLTKRDVIGLRFGTVVGSSSKQRQELLLNKMVADALELGSVNVANNEVRRPTLFLPDLIAAIDILIEKNSVTSQIYNLCSLNMSMEEYSQGVASICGASINQLPNSQTYDFAMSNNLFKTEFDFDFTEDLHLVVKDIAQGIGG